MRRTTIVLLLLLLVPAILALDLIIRIVQSCLGIYWVI